MERAEHVPVARRREVRGQRGRGELRLELDEAGTVKRAAVVPGPLVAPPEAP